MLFNIVEYHETVSKVEKEWMLPCKLQEIQASYRLGFSSGSTQMMTGPGNVTYFSHKIDITLIVKPVFYSVYEQQKSYTGNK